jgi:hypothetical protein
MMSALDEMSSGWGISTGQDASSLPSNTAVDSHGICGIDLESSDSTCTVGGGCGVYGLREGHDHEEQHPVKRCG